MEASPSAIAILTAEEIIAQYPYLEQEDIEEALRYAAWLAEDEVVEFGR